MAKKKRSPYVDELRDKNNISTENHMQLWARLAKVVEMHGPQGPKKPHKN